MRNKTLKKLYCLSQFKFCILKKAVTVYNQIGYKKLSKNHLIYQICIVAALLYEITRIPSSKLKQSIYYNLDVAPDFHVP